jgi:hypothetical protein
LTEETQMSSTRRNKTVLNGLNAIVAQAKAKINIDFSRFNNKNGRRVACYYAVSHLMLQDHSSNFTDYNWKLV